MKRWWIEFIRFCLNDEAPFPQPVGEVDWNGLYELMKKQSLVGLMMRGIRKLEDGTVPKMVLMKAFSVSERAREKNKKVNAKAVEIVEEFSRDGFLCCILKGQGNAVMYPDPLMRAPGDIDIWMRPKVNVGGAKAVRKSVNQYVASKFSVGDLRYYHVEFQTGGIDVEAHYMPGIMNNPLYNRRLQKYYAAAMEKQCRHKVALPDGVGEIPVPTTEFNVIFQLSHIMHHFFDEGIGLRQMMDYYYLLKSGRAEIKDMAWGDRLDYLGLRKFAGAVMYVMREVFGMADDYLIVPVDERRGKTLMDEIIRGGNFGHFSDLANRSAGSKYVRKSWRTLHFVREYPAEALSEPLFRTYHFFWRKLGV